MRHITVQSDESIATVTLNRPDVRNAFNEEVIAEMTQTFVELGVRDDYWTEDEPLLATFRILGGASPDVRRAWNERLDILVQSLG